MEKKRRPWREFQILRGTLEEKSVVNFRNNSWENYLNMTTKLKLRESLVNSSNNHCIFSVGMIGKIFDEVFSGFKGFLYSWKGILGKICTETLGGSLQESLGYSWRGSQLVGRIPQECFWEISVSNIEQISWKKFWNYS